jgi:small subunit ribosomal protein S18e
MFALKAIKGIGRRFSNLVLKIAQIDLNKRAGELTEADIDKINEIIAKPTGKILRQVNSNISC